MSIRHKLLLFTPLLVALPILAWFTLQSTESQFRSVEGASLKARAATAVATIPAGLLDRLDTDYGVALPAPTLPGALRVDGYFGEWGSLPALARRTDGGLDASLWAAGAAQRLALRLVLEPTVADTGLVIIASGNHGLLRFAFPGLTEGPVRAFSAGGQQIGGVVRESEDAQSLEFSVPLSLVRNGLRIQIEREGQPPMQPRQIDFPDSDRFYVVARPDPALETWLTQVTPAGGVGRLVLGERVLLTAGELNMSASALERFMYRWVFEALPALPDRDQWRVHPSGQVVETGDTDSAVAWYGADTGIPVMQVSERLSDELRLILQAPAAATLDAINTVWLRLMLGSLLVFGLVAVGLLLFSSRLVSRIGQLGTAAASAAQDPRRKVRLPQAGARDEIGELARAHGRLLESVGNYARYLDSLASRLSHELRTPLAITRSSLDNLEQAGPGEQAAFLERARQGLDRQARLIGALTEASRLDQALTGGEMEHLDLTGLLDQYLDTLKTTWPDKYIDAQLPDGPVWIEAQPDRIVQLLDKLCENAVSFTPEGGRIVCSLRAQSETVVLSVFNEGSSLPDGDPEGLFDSLVSHRAGGGRHLGLGLYVARQIVVHHKGRIQAENRGSGVVFSVILPSLQT